MALELCMHVTLYNHLTVVFHEHLSGGQQGLFLEKPALEFWSTGNGIHRLVSKLYSLINILSLLLPIQDNEGARETQNSGSLHSRDYEELIKL